MAIRESGGQYSVTIPVKMALEGGYDKAKYVIITQNKNGNLKIRRMEIGIREKGSVQKT